MSESRHTGTRSLLVVLVCGLLALYGLVATLGGLASMLLSSDGDPLWLIGVGGVSGLSAVVSALALWKRNRYAHWAFCAWLAGCATMAVASMGLREYPAQAVIAAALLALVPWLVRRYVRVEPGP